MRLNVEVRAFFIAFFWNSLFGTTFGIFTSMLIFEAISMYVVSVIDQRDEFIDWPKQIIKNRLTNKYRILQT